MNYNEFYKASFRHMFICRELLNNLDALKINSSDVTHVVNEVYYLSGYVLETMISFCVCSQLRVYTNVMEDSRINNKRFRTHNIEKKVEYALENGCNFRNIPFLSEKHSNAILNKLFNSWTVDLRYEPNRLLSLENVQLYVSEINKVFNQLLSKYPTP